jgi:hypothetical protein
MPAVGTRAAISIMATVPCLSEAQLWAVELRSSAGRTTRGELVDLCLGSEVRRQSVRTGVLSDE